MASVEEVDDALAGLLDRLGDVDGSTRALLPSRRVIQAQCPDLGYVRFAEWRQGRMRLLDEPPNGVADIRISVRSDDLLAMTSGELPVGQALASNRLRVDASVTDLLRLRSLL